MKVQFLLEETWSIPDLDFLDRCRAIEGRRGEYIRGEYCLGYTIFEVEVDKLEEIVIRDDFEADDRLYCADSVDVFLNDDGSKWYYVSLWREVVDEGEENE